MPCQSDYLEPTRRERELQRAARLLVYVRQQLGVAIPGHLLAAADSIYCADDFVPALCAALLSLAPERRDALIYNSRDRQARDLADWWEDHQEADRRRVEREQAEAAAAEARAKALAKLTPEERRALGL